MRMPELHDLLERRASRYAPPSDLFDRVLDRRRRRDRNRKLGTVVVAMVVAATAIGVLARAFIWGAGTLPADQTPNRFMGPWSSPDLKEQSGLGAPSTQTMTIRAGEDGVLHITVHDDSTGACSSTPTTMTGTGRLEAPTTLVVPSPVLACDDESDPEVGFLPEWKEAGRDYRLVLDLATDRLYDNYGAVWSRGAPPENWADPSTEAEVDGPGTFAILHGEVTFRAAEPWYDHVDSYLDPLLFFLTSGPGLPDRLVTSDATIEILANPNPLPEGPCYLYPGRVPASAEALVQAIRSNPDLETTMPVAERLGGIDALRMDVAPVPGASTCPNGAVPVVSTINGGWGTMGHGELGRLYILDLPGGSARTLVIMITASEAAFEQAVQAAAPVVDSFEFHTG
jgi:hypothetical protein